MKPEGILVHLDIVSSRAKARKHLATGSVKINGVTVEPETSIRFDSVTTVEIGKTMKYSRVKAK